MQQVYELRLKSVAAAIAQGGRLMQQLSVKYCLWQLLLMQAGHVLSKAAICSGWCI
jgi:hypothetical protein